MHTVYYIILVASTFLFASLMTASAYVLLQRLDLIDQPEERSNHNTAIPTGAGIAFMVIAIGFLLVANAPGNLLWPALILTVVSFLDDRHSLPVMKRLGFQAIAVIIAVTTVKEPIFQGLLPLWLDYMLMGLAWMWIINLYNFMDGIDEITVTETGSITIGLLVIGLFVSDIPRFISIDAVIILAAILAFLPWNRHPAKMFMGDSGSIPLGFFMGYLLFNLAGSGYWVAALILPAYYLADATLTLLKRAAAKKPIWQAHSEHYYQQAVRAGRGHDQVSRTILLLNLVLIILAGVSTIDPMISYASLVAAYVATGFVMYRFSQPPKAQLHEVAA